ncbi:MAG: lysozyme inhibitor LprI family protein, partial [Leptolyngbyaceae cyanobacterium]
SLCAIAACEQAPSATDPYTTPPPEESAEPTENEPTAATPTDSAETSPEAEPEATAPATAPEPKPVPSLPEGCTNPETQTMMNTCAQAEYEQADVKLNNAYQSVKASVNAQKADQLITAEQAWLTFRDSYCDFVQSQFAGGSLQPTIYYTCMTQLTNDRTAVLQQTASSGGSFESADQALNTVYQDLQGGLSADEQAQLTDAQLAWLDYRDAHCAFEGGATDACMAQVTSIRVEQLQQQIENNAPL